jgi:hypothetical protein
VNGCSCYYDSIHLSVRKKSFRGVWYPSAMGFMNENRSNTVPSATLFKEIDRMFSKTVHFISSSASECFFFLNGHHTDRSARIMGSGKDVALPGFAFG